MVDESQIVSVYGKILELEKGKYAMSTAGFLEISLLLTLLSTVELRDSKSRLEIALSVPCSGKSSTV